MGIVRRSSSGTTRTRSRAEEPEEETPRTRRSARGRSAEPEFTEPTDDGAFESEDEDAPRSRRGRSSRDESFRRGADEGSERPARGRRSSQDEDEGDERPARGRRSSRDDDDDEPRNADAIQSGWGAAKKLKAEGGTFANEFKITDKPQLIVFLQDEPYAVYKQHWVESGLSSTKKKSFICWGDKSCPLCVIGERADKKYAFNVAVITGKEGQEEAEIKSLIAGVTLFDNILDEHEGSDGPLTSGPWTLHKTGEKKKPTYKLKRIEGRKLDADWRLTEEEVEEIVEESDLELYTKDQHRPPAKSYLQGIADELLGDD